MFEYGLKSLIHRRILYGMNELVLLLINFTTKKFVSYDGDVMAFTYTEIPLIYEVMVWMARMVVLPSYAGRWSRRLWSMDGDGPRSTTVYEARMSKISLEMLRANKNTADFADNYDSSER